MPKVAFLIPASPNAAFFSQIAAFRRAIGAGAWTRWEPSTKAFFGGTIDPHSRQQWSDELADVEQVYLDQERFERDGYFAQGDARLEAGASDADVVVLSDADTLLVGSIEDVLDRVLQRSAVAGVNAHFSFPTEKRHAGPSEWNELALALIGKPLLFDREYTLVPPSDDKEPRAAPFYLNFGAIFIASDAIPSVAANYLPLRKKVWALLDQPYFAGQVAFTLALAASEIAKISLPISYNFPNDPRADRLYPDSLEDVRLFHYLRTQKFDRQKIFKTAEEYDDFVSMKLDGSDALFQSSVKSILGNEYPFRHALSSVS